MIDYAEISLILDELINILRGSSQEQWILTLTHLKDEADDNPLEFAHKMKRIYSGMGSFNDLIIYKNGQMSITDNNRFDFLRAKLFDLCKQVL